MKYLSVLLLFLALATGCHSQGDPPPLQTGAIAPEKRLPPRQMDSLVRVMGYVPEGVQFALAILEDSSVQYYGFQRVADSLSPVDNSDGVFEIGSISKVFTAALLAQEVQAGTLALDTTIGALLDLELKAGEDITLVQLANHTSGLPRVPSNLLPASLLHPDNPYQNYDEEALRKYLEEKIKLNSEPGERYSYSNLGAGLLGYLLEQHSGKSYEQLLQEKIFTPLGMNSSSAQRKGLEDRLVRGRNAKGKITSNWDFQALAGAGAILSTPQDMALFCRAHFRDTLPFLALSREETFQASERMSLALGWHILKQEDGRQWYWHNGGTGGYRSSMVLDVEHRRAVVLLTNLSAGHRAAGQIDGLSFFLMP